ncbi:MAG: helix-turn-helix transcriptional regulator [Chloroflexi bacterium]|nr:helix-turn-helix transcriptional regulator [Chloroflexota bacterium]
MGNFESSAKLFKTLMHPARLEILDILRDGEHCVCHLEAALGYRQAYISQQLMVLREAGLVQDRRDGWNMYYRVVQPSIYAVIDAAQQAQGGARIPARRKATHAAMVDGCSCPQCSPLEKVAA